jgi:hypothetical protein
MMFDDDEGPIAAPTVSCKPPEPVSLGWAQLLRKGLEIPMAYWMDLVLSSAA